MLYKKKYLIAVYDEDGEFLEDVLVSEEDRKNFLESKGIKAKPKHFFANMVHRHKGQFPFIKHDQTKNIFYFVNVLERHNDTFSECDLVFLNWYISQEFERVNRKGIIWHNYRRKIEKSAKLK